MPPKKRPLTKSGRPRKRKGVKLEPTQLGPQELALAEPPAEGAALARAVEGEALLRDVLIGEVAVHTHDLGGTLT